MNNEHFLFLVVKSPSHIMLVYLLFLTNLSTVLKTDVVNLLCEKNIISVPNQPTEQGLSIPLTHTALRKCRLNNN